MNWDELFSYLKNNWDALTSNAMLKILSGIAVLKASEMLEIHLLLFSLFIGLIIIDLLTKWVAISHIRLKEKNLDACLWCSIKGIKAARTDGDISSDKMKHRFASKISAYLIVVITACFADIMMNVLKKPVLFVDLIVWYLAITELLSIIENLNDAGVEATNKLLQLIKNKTGLGGTKNNENIYQSWARYILRPRRS